MAINIPMPGQPGDALLKGIDTGGSLFSRIMDPILKREQLAQQMKIHQDALAMQKAAAARAGANADLQRRLAELNLQKAEMEIDPAKKIAYIQSLMQGMQGMGSQGGANVSEPQNYDLLRQKLEAMGLFGQPNEIQEEQGMPAEGPQVSETMGQGMFPQEAMQEPPQYPVEEPQPPANNGNPFAQPNLGQMILGADIKKRFGFNPFPSEGNYKEPPSLKRANDLQSKMQEAQYKHELKLAEAAQKEELKNEASKRKVINQANNDLPHLEETLRSLKIMQKIAEDPKNDDLFGHWFEGHDTAAARATNPNAGTWQVYGLDPIVAAEMKMSARGNQLALKSALQNKANFAETRPVAAAKLKGSIDKVERQIKEMKRISGRITPMAEVRELNGKKYKKIQGEWHEVD